MATVNCYLPAELKERAEACHPPINFSGALRRGLIELLGEQQHRPNRAEPVEDVA